MPHSSLLGQVDGRTSAAVQAWLAAARPRSGPRSRWWSSTYTPATPPRAALPDAAVAVDHFHLIMLASRAVTAMRQRVTQIPELTTLAETIETWWPAIAPRSPSSINR